MRAPRVPDGHGHRLRLTLLGVPIRLVTDAAPVAAAAHAAYGDDRARTGAGPALELRIDVDAGMVDGDGPPAASLPTTDRLTLGGPGAEGEADARRGTARARVSSSALAAPWFRESVLDHLALFLVTARDRTPLHAAAIVRDGRALVLAGPSGVGKSSLTYAAMRAGHRILAEDVVFVQLHPAPRLWAMAERLHLSPSATRHFSELAGSETVRRPDGRDKIPVRIPEAARAAVPWTGPTGLCLLGDAGAGSPAVEPLSLERALEELRATLQGGFHRFDHVLEDCVRAVGSGGCWRLRRVAEPEELVRRLDTVFDAITPATVRAGGR